MACEDYSDTVNEKSIGLHRRLHLACRCKQKVRQMTFCLSSREFPDLALCCKN